MNKICKHCGEVIHRGEIMWRDSAKEYPQYCRMGRARPDLGGNLHEPKEKYDE